MIDKLNIPIRDKLTKKIIYALDLDLGVWLKYEYNSSDNQIYYEDDSGFWSKYEYDNEGKRIYYEDTHGHIRDDR